MFGKILLNFLSQQHRTCFLKHKQKQECNAVAEPISTSTPQMSYVVKRVNENSQNTMKEQRRGNNYNR